MQKKHVFLSLIAAIASFSILNAADEIPLNKGLSEPQHPGSLPRSRTTVEQPERLAKVQPQPKLVAAKDSEFILSGGWEMIAADELDAGGAQISGALNTSDWYNATVPGTVLTTLVDQGVYPDPLYGLNNMSIPETLCRQNWWYRTRFTKPDLASWEGVRLLFNGINYEAHVWLNGQMIGSIKGAFIRGDFEITDLLLEENVLAIQIIPPPNPGIPHEQSAIFPKGHNGGTLVKDGPTFVCTEGWDWIPAIRDRNIGLWQDVRLKVVGGARIIDPQIITDLPLPDISSADITIKTTIAVAEAGDYELELSFADRRVEHEMHLVEGINEIALSPETYEALHLNEPKLWWPNGYGEPNLYTLNMVLRDDMTREVDRKTVRFGVREVSYDFTVVTEEEAFKRVYYNPTTIHAEKQTALFDNLSSKEMVHGTHVPALFDQADLDQLSPSDPEGNPYLVFKVNGVDIFVKGGNWGLSEAMKRVSRERMEPYFKLHKDAHYTMIRNWVGQSTESVFYELADEYGLLVWNDFWMSTQDYNYPPEDFDLFYANALDTVKRFRNHPSIVLWCARNEGWAPVEIEKRLADMIVQEDGTRMYQSSSNKLNLRYSGPWHFIEDVGHYFRKIAEGFSTEIGTLSFPTGETLRGMMAEEDAWPIGDAWYYHDVHTHHESYRATITRFYSEPRGLDDFLKKAQMINYVQHRAIFEAWNSRLWDDASGVLLWMTHPAWPSVIWQTYTYDYETHGAYFGAKKACEPIHIQLNAHDGKVVAVNTTRDSLSGLKVLAQLLNEKGEVLHQQEMDGIELPANQKLHCFDFTPPADEELPDVTFTKLILSDVSGAILSDNFYWDSRRKAWNYMFYTFNLYPNVELAINHSVEVVDGWTRGTLEIENPSGIVALAIKLNLRESATDERILPAYFSDGYFSLMPGERRIVTFECPKELDPSSYTISAEGYNVSRQSVHN